MKKLLIKFVLILIMGISLVANYLLGLAVIAQQRKIDKLVLSAKADSIINNELILIIKEDAKRK